MTYADTLVWTWRVVFVNERMGFRKSFDVAEKKFDDALTAAWRALEEKKYNQDDFDVVEVVRVRKD